MMQLAPKVLLMDLELEFRSGGWSEEWVKFSVCMMYAAERCITGYLVNEDRMAHVSHHGVNKSQYLVSHKTKQKQNS